MAGTLFVVATPIGNLEDISARALRVLREVAVIAAEDTRRTSHLLARYAITTSTTSLHEHNEGAKAAILIARLQQGDHVALVSDAGMPTISDPGRHLVRQAVEAGIKVEVIPGPSAITSALAASGFKGQTFTFMGFPPTRSSDRNTWLAELTSAGRTVVFFEAPHRIRQTLEDIQAVAGDVRVCVGRELTKTHEELVIGPISAALKRFSAPVGEFTVVVEIGRKTITTDGAPASDDELLKELGLMTSIASVSKRKAINAIARRHRRPPNEVYAAVERARKLAK